MYHESYEPSKTFAIQSQHEENSYCGTGRSCISFFYQPLFYPFQINLRHRCFLSIVLTRQSVREIWISSYLLLEQPPRERSLAPHSPTDVPDLPIYIRHLFNPPVSDTIVATPSYRSTTIELFLQSDIIERPLCLLIWFIDRREHRPRGNDRGWEAAPRGTSLQRPRNKITDDVFHS